MKSRITKLAAAALIIIAAYVVINQSGGSINIATVTFAQITENMKQMPWLHGVVEGTDARLEGGADRLEAWLCYERRITVTKKSSGEVWFQDDLEHILQVYDPVADTITVSRVSPQNWNKIGGSALDLPKVIMKMFEDAGEKATRQTGKHKGKDALIFKMSAFLGGMDLKVEMTVDAKMQVVVFINQQAFDKTGKLIFDANAHFDYPETGPESIYDVGIHRSAKTVHDEEEEEKSDYDKAFEEAISVVDARERWPEPRELVVAYWQARNAKNYDEMAVLWPSSAVWNQELEKEEPVEYVFGEVKPWGIEGGVIVPYASKRYHDKHGKYNLKMVLTNKNSAKGRYYIKSGN
jgi:hypothetical protein